MFLLFLFSCMMNSELLFDFNDKTNNSAWNIVDDGVMGGLSFSRFTINASGHGVFKGTVSTENYGGFCSVRHDMKPLSLKGKKSFTLRLKGDGKKYQFRVKANSRDYYNYIYEFQTTTDWQTIEIPISEMYASFRGRTLDIPNYDGERLSEMAFLIGNKKEESFQLLLDKIEVK